MSYSNDRKYTKEHEWIKLDSASQTATVGITAFAVEQLGDVVHLDLPEVGKKFKMGDSFGTVESTKTVSDLYMPATGEVVARNNELVDAPEDLPDDAHEKGWLVKIKVTEVSKDLLSAAEYEKYIQEEANK
jgi:glycine cleavage system H protein